MKAWARRHGWAHAPWNGVWSHWGPYAFAPVSAEKQPSSAAGARLWLEGRSGWGVWSLAQTKEWWQERNWSHRPPKVKLMNKSLSRKLKNSCGSLQTYHSWIERPGFEYSLKKWEEVLILDQVKHQPKKRCLFLFSVYFCQDKERQIIILHLRPWFGMLG